MLNEEKERAEVIQRNNRLQLISRRGKHLAKRRRINSIRIITSFIVASFVIALPVVSSGFTSVEEDYRAVAVESVEPAVSSETPVETQTPKLSVSTMPSIQLVVISTKEEDTTTSATTGVIDTTTYSLSEDPVETEPAEPVEQPIVTATPAPVQAQESVETTSAPVATQAPVSDDVVRNTTEINDTWADASNSGYEHYVEEPAWVSADEIIFTPDYNEDGSINWYGYDEESWHYLSMCIYGEGGHCSYKWQMFIGSVVLNRVYHSAFKQTTVKSICLAPSQYTCFGSGYESYLIPTEMNKQVAYELLKGGSILPWNVVFQAQFKQGDGVYEHIGNTYFCYIDWGEKLN